jgi:hypothetical protein
MLVLTVVSPPPVLLSLSNALTKSMQLNDLQDHRHFGFISIHIQAINHSTATSVDVPSPSKSVSSAPLHESTNDERV